MYFRHASRKTISGNNLGKALLIIFHPIINIWRYGATDRGLFLVCTFPLEQAITFRNVISSKTILFICQPTELAPLYFSVFPLGFRSFWDVILCLLKVTCVRVKQCNGTLEWSSQESALKNKTINSNSLQKGDWPAVWKDKKADYFKSCVKEHDVVHYSSVTAVYELPFSVDSLAGTKANPVFASGNGRYSSTGRNGRERKGHR